MRTLLAGLVFVLATGCGGKEEKGEEPDKLPPPDKMFDKSKTPVFKGDIGKKDKGTAG